LTWQDFGAYIDGSSGKERHMPEYVAIDERRNRVITVFPAENEETARRILPDLVREDCKGEYPLGGTVILAVLIPGVAWDLGEILQNRV